MTKKDLIIFILYNAIFILCTGIIIGALCETRGILLEIERTGGYIIMNNALYKMERISEVE